MQKAQEQGQKGLGNVPGLQALADRQRLGSEEGHGKAHVARTLFLLLAGVSQGDRDDR